MAEHNIMVRLGVGAAASRLGVSVEAVRKRIHRGSLRAEKVEGRWMVLFPATADVLDAGRHVPPASSPAGQDARTAEPTADPQTYRELVASLRSEVEFLRRELAARSEDLKRRDEAMAELLRSVTPPPTASERGGSWPFWKRREK